MVQGEVEHSGICNLGILFIIIDDFPNEPLWRLWLEHGGVSDTPASVKDTTVDTDNSAVGPVAEPIVRCWFHAKNPSNVRSAWVRERLVTSFQLRPEWGSIDLTKVMAHMLHEVNTDVCSLEASTLFGKVGTWAGLFFRVRPVQVPSCDPTIFTLPSGHHCSAAHQQVLLCLRVLRPHRAPAPGPAPHVPQ
jgi:hypothetical protein